MKQPELDSDKLDYRAVINTFFSKDDFDRWVVNNLELRTGLDVLDIGCGTGKHLFKISKIIGDNGTVMGLDKDNTSLSRCIKRLMVGRFKNVEIIKADLVSLKENIDRKFDRILSSFSIYYTKDKIKTMQDCKYLLKDKGKLFICGPRNGNNQELRKLIHLAGGTESEQVKKWSHFIEDEILPEAKRLFHNVKVTTFDNEIIFTDGEFLFNYWKATASYDQSIKKAMRKCIESHFKRYDQFKLTKKVIGIGCTNQ